MKQDSKETVLMELEHVGKIRGEKHVLHDVSFAVKAGRIIGVAGDNGQGKTTLLALMAGLLRTDAGVIHRYADRISYVNVKEEFYNWMKVKDALFFYRDYYDNFDIARAEQLLEENGIAQQMKISVLSRGLQERLFLILAVSQTAEIYLMDEPFSGLDPYFKKDIRRFLLQNLPENATIVMATHLLREMEQLFDEVIFVMKSGVQLLKTDEIREKYGKSVEQYYLEVMKHER